MVLAHARIRSANRNVTRQSAATPIVASPCASTIGSSRPSVPAIPRKRRRTRSSAPATGADSDSSRTTNGAVHNNAIASAAYTHGATTERAPQTT